MFVPITHPWCRSFSSITFITGYDCPLTDIVQLPWMNLVHHESFLPWMFCHPLNSQRFSGMKLNSSLAEAATYPWCSNSILVVHLLAYSPPSRPTASCIIAIYIRTSDIPANTGSMSLWEKRVLSQKKKAFSLYFRGNGSQLPAVNPRHGERFPEIFRSLDSISSTLNTLFCYLFTVGPH